MAEERLWEPMEELKSWSLSLAWGAHGLLGCVGQVDINGNGPLPKPSLSAWPSSVAPRGSNVTLRCTSPSLGVHFVLRKEAVPLDSRPLNHLTESTAEFYLTDLRQGDAGHYTCECHRKGFQYSVSPPSDVLLLLVTGYLPKPSLHAHQRGQVAAGGKVTLQCQVPDVRILPVMFVLLKEGALFPIQLYSSAGTVADFSLQDMRASDSGNYSCVYHQAKPPFRASNPSSPFEVLVTVPPSTTAEVYTKGNLIRLGLAAAIIVILGVFLGEACHGQRESASASSPHSAPGD